MSAIKVVNYQNTFNKFRKAKLKLKDRRKVNKAATIYLVRWIYDNFQQKGRPVGGWKPLAPSTIKEKKKLGYTTDPLIRTGKLRKNWNLIYNTKVAKVVSKQKYAIFHEKGTKKNRPPRRKILPTNKMIMPQLRKIYGFYVKAAFK